MKFKIPDNQIRIVSIVATIIIFFASLFVGLHHNKNRPLTDYHRELKADKSGYNVYLPALFIYHFKTENLPDSIEEKAGHGFTIDTAKHKIITKYPYGVALLQLPFWSVAHGLAEIKDGYSSVAYYSAIDWAASFYLALGLLLIFNAASYYFQNKSRLLWITFLVLPFATNLFYYATYDGGMSHVYSFCVIAGYLYSYIRYIRNHSKNFLLPALLFALAILIRPVNIIFIWVLLFIDCINLNDFIHRLKYLVQPKHSLLLIGFIFLLLIPQLGYNYYATSKLTLSLYSDETFQYFPALKVPEVLMAPNNGIFTYTPAFIFVLLGCWCFAKNQRFFAFAILYVFLVYILFYGSWWSYFLGCAFGHRGLVEFYPLFVFSIMAFFEKQSQNKFRSIVFTSLLIFFMLCTTLMAKRYDCCYYGNGDWDWNYYFQYLSRTLLFK